MNFLLAPERKKQKDIFLENAYLMKQALSLCAALVPERDRFEAGFMEAVWGMINQWTLTGSGGEKKGLAELNAHIAEMVKESVSSEGVVNLFSDRKAAESSETVRARVSAARKIQLERFQNDGIRTNAEMNGPLIRRYCNPQGESEKLLRDAFQKLQLSARAYQRVLKVARTIADLESSETIRPEHYAEAIQYRRLTMLADL